MSHPTRVRGLKFFIFRWPVAIRELSHPTRVRGLKWRLGAEVDEIQRSHPTRVRGLK